ncbi:ADP-ribosylglycohydrolase family protein [Flavihumibacter solisilvae]|uniref:Crystallin n=1 Tax=Flavihumibacter solisilvae TaxID=1349421 RepID=A0A0C1LLK5_9BACT|nr:ADP-ribosylglycohydrolase family protein [Flavihumibacter solisilvae]KIC96223.1 crystallin [Flavihumibacter solisilvae]
MRKIWVTLYMLMATASFASAQEKTFVLSRQQLKDKIKGGWAGQTIGVTFGGPYEFQFNGTLIGDYQPLKWYDGYVKQTMINSPGLYDDLYMDLTFVEVFDKYGLDAPVDSFANAYAHAGYALWHANQAGRYNILQGLRPPLSGHWMNNPHADCIDYQIESDFAGLMSPGMPNSASAISDKIGHIMNYGDGWYGGVYIGAMYSLAFVSKDLDFIVREALKTIPARSEFHQCISDVINWHKKYPSDWKQTWFEVQKKWADDIGCPEGVFVPFNIDAKVNAAYVVIGLLYGHGDFTKTLEITTRCGQDADCNPSSAGGILGTVLGYDQIPAYWRMGLKEAEAIDFKYTTISLEEVYDTGFKHALLNLERNGGSIKGDSIIIKTQQPRAVKFEKSFEGLYPVAKIPVKWNSPINELVFEFEGTGFVIRGETARWASESPYVFNTELYINDKLIESPILPANFTTRRYELCWKYDLPKGKYAVRLKIKNPSADEPIKAWEAIVYSNQPSNGIRANEKR